MESRDDLPALTAAHPARPVAPWLGGKRNLARRLIERIDVIPHAFYGEPFVGMAGVFLRRRSRPRAEAINDISRDIATLFRILQRHYPQFLETLRFGLTTRVEFERLVATDPSTLTDLERAARFLYLQRTAFGGKVSGRNFGVAPDRPARFNLTTLEPMLEDLHVRLSGVVIECLPWERFLARYDRLGALFYVDPPYWGCEGDYGPVFAREDFARLAAALRGLQGRFILSINDLPEVRETFAGFEIEAVETTYTIAKGGAQTGRRELIVTGGAG